MLELNIRTETESGFCEVHGFFENVGMIVGGRTVWSGCTLCAYEKIEKENKMLAIEAERRHTRRIFEATGLPRRFEGKSLTSYRATEKGQRNALETALKYVEDLDGNLATGAGLLFYGKPGTGKTHLAVGIALEFIENNLSVIYTRAGAIVREVKESWGRKATQTESQIYEKYARPDLLIIDEIGRQFGTDTERMILFEVINARYEQRKPVLAVTNLDGANLAECLGAATLDRLRECGTSVCFDWESMRPKL
mgnify:CR=1 FL=1